MDIIKIKEYIKLKGLPDFRYKQIVDNAFSGKCESFKDITSLPENLRKELEEKFDFYSIKCLNVFESKVDKSFKFLFELYDKNKIETMVFEKEKGEWVICLSTQVGCPVGCKFCASGRKGLKRNLNYDEITDQFLYSKNYLTKKNLGSIKRVVYMGIGEPFYNYENLKKSINIINQYFEIGKRNISVSTFGYIPRIRDFAKDMPQVNLAISLHSADQKRRDELIPFASKYPLVDLQKALSDYLLITNRKLFIEYVMIKEVNDRIKDIYNIIKFIDGISKRKYFTVNLIPYNPTSSKFQPSSSQRIKEFCNTLVEEGISCTIRKSYGGDINGACGQLVSY